MSRTTVEGVQYLFCKYTGAHYCCTMYEACPGGGGTVRFCKSTGTHINTTVLLYEPCHGKGGTVPCFCKYSGTHYHCCVSHATAVDGVK